MGVWIPGYFDGKAYVKGHIAKGTISTVIDEIQKTGHLPKPPEDEKPAPAQEAAVPVVFTIEQPLTGKSMGSVAVATMPEKPVEAVKASLEDRVTQLQGTLEKLMKLAAGL